jgi:Putative inner membrane exporter, YdcZ
VLPGPNIQSGFGLPDLLYQWIVGVARLMVGVGRRLFRCGLHCAVDRPTPAIGRERGRDVRCRGQMLGALAFDQLGLMGLERIPVAPLRLAGALPLVGGVLLMRLSLSEPQVHQYQCR